MSYGAGSGSPTMPASELSEWLVGTSQLAYSRLPRVTFGAVVDELAVTGEVELLRQRGHGGRGAVGPVGSVIQSR